MKKVVLLLFALMLILGCSSGSGSNASSDSQLEIFPSEMLVNTLPSKFIAVAIFTSRSYETAEDALDRVNVISEKAVSTGIQVINLVVDWRDIEPTELGITEFELLEDMIAAIKSRGLYCVLRIYTNAEGNWQAWPAFINPIDVFTISEQTEVFPWDIPYQTAWSSFQYRLTEELKSADFLPDAMQITLGGSFGEQVLGKYDSSSWNDAFNEKLFTAEKWHIDSYVNTLGTLIETDIVMINKLKCPDINYEDRVGLHAMRNGTAWIQTNAGACFLAKQDYGPGTCKMLARFMTRGAKLWLEDESGNWSCAEVGLPSSLSNRVDCMLALQADYEIEFSAISINTADLYDSEGVSKLKEMLGL